MALLEPSVNINKHFTFYTWSHDCWIADSGASTHVANSRDMLATYTPIKGTPYVIGVLTATIEGTGVVYIRGIVNG